MQFASDWSVYGVRALLLLAAFAGLRLGAVERAAPGRRGSHAQLAARLETALDEIRRLSGQVIALGGSIETLVARSLRPRRELGRRLSQAQAPAPAARRDILGGAIHAATKPRSAWRAAAPPSKRSSRAAARRARKPNYYGDCTNAANPVGPSPKP